TVLRIERTVLIPHLQRRPGAEVPDAETMWVHRARPQCLLDGVARYNGLARYGFGWTGEGQTPIAPGSVGVRLHQDPAMRERISVVVFRHRVRHVVGNTSWRNYEVDHLFRIASGKVALINELDSPLVAVNEFESNLQQLAGAHGVRGQFRDLEPASDSAGWLQSARHREAIVGIDVLARLVDGEEPT